MDPLSFSLVVLVLFVPLLAYFATTQRKGPVSAPDSAPNSPGPPQPPVTKGALYSDLLRAHRSSARAVSRECAPVLRQNVVVARLMRVEGGASI